MKYQTIIEVSKKRLIWFAVLFWYFEMEYLSTISIINRTYTALKLLGIIFLLLNIKRISLNKMFLAISAIEISVWFSTFRMGTPISSTTMAVFRVLVFCVIIDTMMKKDARACIDVLYSIMELLIVLNVLSMLLFPNGLYDPDNLGPTAIKKYYLLGHQNSMGIYALVGITLGGLRCIYDKSIMFKWRFIILVALSFFYDIKVWSVISIIGLGGVTALILFDFLTNKGIKLHLVAGIVFNTILFVLIVIEQNVAFLSQLISNVFHRDITFSGRTVIWQKAILSFLREPIWGVGNGQGKLIFGVVTAHNRYLNTLFTSGTVGFVLLIVVFLLLSFKLKDLRKQPVRILTYYFIVLLTVMQGESYVGMPFYVLIVVAYRLEEIVVAVKDENISKKSRFAVLWPSHYST